MYNLYMCVSRWHMKRIAAFLKSTQTNIVCSFIVGQSKILLEHSNQPQMQVNTALMIVITSEQSIFI